MKKLPRSSPGSFSTVFWALLAIAIAAILAVLVLSMTGSTHDRGRGRGAAEIQAMMAGLESYKADRGDYPTGTNLDTTSTGHNAFLFLALHGTNGSGKIYVEFNKNQTNASGCLVDPFGNAYGYQYPGDPKRSGTNFPDLWSVAKSPNNTNAWLVTW